MLVRDKLQFFLHFGAYDLQAPVTPLALHPAMLLGHALACADNIHALFNSVPVPLPATTPSTTPSPPTPQTFERITTSSQAILQQFEASRIPYQHIQINNLTPVPRVHSQTIHYSAWRCSRAFQSHLPLPPPCRNVTSPATCRHLGTWLKQNTTAAKAGLKQNNAAAKASRKQNSTGARARTRLYREVRMQIPSS